MGDDKSSAAATLKNHQPTRPGKRLHSYGKIHQFLMGKSTISMAIFNSYVKLPEGIFPDHPLDALVFFPSIPTLRLCGTCGTLLDLSIRHCSSTFERSNYSQLPSGKLR